MAERKAQESCIQAISLHGFLGLCRLDAVVVCLQLPARFRYPLHQDVVVDVVEELRDVNIHHPVLASLDVFLRRSDGFMRTTPRTKTVARLAEGVNWLSQILGPLQAGGTVGYYPTPPSGLDRP